ncbi:hypothetical protein ACFYNY_24975 [Streptomyces sp. NPDC006530]|uniref:hypothetical protein n=1 Tax=Streptomyces sp. NPDC006530 TaxID=3364750 RepID=UPI0036AB05B1
MAAVSFVVLVAGAADEAVADEYTLRATAVASPSSGARLEFDWDKVETGAQVAVSITGMPPGWDLVTVSSPALKGPVELTPVRPGAQESSRFPRAKGEAVRDDIAPGVYPVTAVSGGRPVATASLTVVAPAAAEIARFVAGPKGGRLGVDDSTPKVVVRPGSEIVVLLADYNAARNEDVLTVKSTAFQGPLTIKRGTSDAPRCKCDDGTTVFAGHTTLRDDIPAGTYPLTVVSHHGQQTSSAQLKVAGDPVRHYQSWVVGGASVVLLATVGGIVLIRRRRSAATA